MLTIAGGILLALVFLHIAGAFLGFVEEHDEMLEAFAYVAFSLAGLGLYHLLGV